MKIHRKLISFLFILFLSLSVMGKSNSCLNEFEFKEKFYCLDIPIPILLVMVLAMILVILTVMFTVLGQLTSTDSMPKPFLKYSHKKQEIQNEEAEPICFIDILKFGFGIAFGLFLSLIIAYYVMSLIGFPIPDIHIWL